MNLGHRVSARFVGHPVRIAIVKQWVTKSGRRACKTMSDEGHQI